MTTSACGCEAPEPQTDEEEETVWWRDREVMLPVLSGVALLAGLVSEWSGAGILAQTFFWLGLILGGSTFVPGALRGLFTKGALGISLLMTISAVGAVVLGYVGEAAALAFLYSIVEALEDKAMGRARSDLRALLFLVPETARVRRRDETLDIPAEDLRVGDVLIVSPGERVATDGVVVAGRSSLDTSAITGESIPVEVTAGDHVPAGAINSAGVLEIEATAAGTDNSLTTIVELVEQAQNEKGERARIADRLARPLVPGVLILAALVAVIGSLLGDPGVWVPRSLVVLVAASPCALAISVPITVVSAIGAASRFGVVFKSGAAFERFGDVRHVAFDKTGTLTRNQPRVLTVLSAEGVDEHDVLGAAAALEQHSTHPLAAAITAAAPGARPATEVQEISGHGLTGLVDGTRVTVGSPRWLDPDHLAGRVTELENEGVTVVLVHRDEGLLGAVGVRDELRPEVPETVADLRARGVDVTMLTGDNRRTARALAEQAGIEDVRAELRPEDKASAIAELSRTRTTVMIGDGVNDAPALAGADVGVAMGATGSDAAIESADVAFTGQDLRLFPQALDHARRGRRIMTQNIVLSLLIIAVLLPLAITGALGLAAVVLVHEGAEVVVILNGLRAARTTGTGVSERAPEPDARSPISA